MMRSVQGAHEGDERIMLVLGLHNLASRALVSLELATLVSISTAAAVTDVPANDTHKVVGNEEGVVNPYVCL